MLRLISFIAGRVTVPSASGHTRVTATPLSGHAPRKLDGSFFSAVRVPSELTISAGFGVTNRGIVVGSNATPVSTGDTALLDLIPHGSAAGQLIYSTLAHDVISPLSMGQPDIWSFRVARLFQNASTTTNYIREIGIIAAVRAVHDHVNVMIARDVPPQEIVVPANDMVTIQYTILFRRLP